MYLYLYDVCLESFEIQIGKWHIIPIIEMKCV